MYMTYPQPKILCHLTQPCMVHYNIPAMVDELRWVEACVSIFPELSHSLSSSWPLSCASRILQLKLFPYLTHSHSERLTLGPLRRGISVSRISEDAKRSWAVARVSCQEVLDGATVGWVSTVWPVCLSAMCRTRVLLHSQSTTQDQHTYKNTVCMKGRLLYNSL